MFFDFIYNFRINKYLLINALKFLLEFSAFQETENNFNVFQKPLLQNTLALILYQALVVLV